MSNITIFLLSLLLIGIVEGVSRKEPPKVQHEKYCNTFKTCRDCKTAKYPCEWCHNIGCTGSAYHYCPKVFQQSMQARSDANTCPKIDAGSAVFAPANIRNIIKVNLTTKNWDIGNHRIVCILDIEYKTIQGAGTMHGRTIYCDMAEIKTKRDIMVGNMRVVWGGADPVSNNVLVVGYRCEGLARNCDDCKKVHDGFDCGWCEESSSCTVLQHCPRQHGKWYSKSNNCYKEKVAIETQNTHAKTNAAFKTF